MADEHVLLCGSLDEELRSTCGSDSDGASYKSILHMWDRFLRLSEVDVGAGAGEAAAQSVGGAGIARWYSANAGYWEVRAVSGSGSGSGGGEGSWQRPD